MLNRLLSLSLIFLITATGLYATHNRAGEITFEQIGDLTIRMTITTYTKTSSTSADRDSLEIFWGDDTSEFVARSNGLGDELDNDVKVNLYIAEHTYPGRATYTIFFMDPNRVGSILNVNPPNSVDVPFYLETSFTFLNTQFQGINNSPQLLQAPLDFACVGQPFFHNPNAYDPDGDSLAYELIVPLQQEGTPVPDYSRPDQIAPGLDNIVSLNEVTGEFSWIAPKIQGEYNIAIRINEFRDGLLISSIVRDMQILVMNCDNRPPTIETVDEICVIAGETIDLEILVDDVDEGQQVMFSGTGGPFEQELSPAEITTESIYQDVPFTTSFIWETRCEHISEHYYQVVFRAVDDFLGNTGLATLKTIRIKVVGPPPENLTAEPLEASMLLRWDFPYSCMDTEDNYFQGFSVWRKLLSNPFPFDSCEVGLDGRGYEKIEFNTNANNGSFYEYEDVDIEDGRTYCYRVLAEFALISPSGNPFNRVESIPSNEICMQLKRDIPLLTTVTVEGTDEATGSIFIDWIRPLAVDLDTIANPGPYRYVLRGGDSPSTLQEIPGADFTSTFFNEEVDTSFLHTNINTVASAFFYEVDFYSGNGTTPFGSSNMASSVFLNIEPNDQRLELDWEYFTPWVNHTFIIYRFDDATQSFDSIGITSEEVYVDRELENGTEYCYLVESLGSYGLDDIPDPLVNRSQERCAIPVDLEPPCPPELIVQSVCDKIDDIKVDDELFNELFWTNPDIECIETNDVSFFNVYFSLDGGSSYEIIEVIQGTTTLNFNHIVDDNLLGCYAVTAVDINGNESEFSNIICVDNCPLYELPNTFTPNGDGFNDLFIPIKNVFISRVEFKVFNRWGNLVFETEDPILNWNGDNFSNEPLSDGTYYYTSKVFEQLPSGTVEEIDFLSGFIHLIRG